MNPTIQSPRIATALPISAPRLLVVVDTEEEFDWSKPLSRSETRVDHIRHQDRAQNIFARYGIVPTYVVDYPVASQEAGFRPLRDWLMDGKCRIGAHLHPWVNPPFEEELSARNSYPGNLPAALEKAKLTRLTEMIEANFSRRPTVYRAGRYGIGAGTGAILEALGYETDTSVVPFTNFGGDGGPNFSDFDAEPFWLDPAEKVLELPLTVAWHGHLHGLGKTVQPSLMSPVGLQLHLPGLFARLGLLERIRLTPEGNSLDELKRLTDISLAAGRKLFVFSYHSPSLVPGNTPYVRDEAELRGFLRVIEQYCEYFCGICGGEGSTLDEVRTWYDRDPEHHRSVQAEHRARAN
jgi:hypothetical protein